MHGYCHMSSIYHGGPQAAVRGAVTRNAEEEFFDPRCLEDLQPTPRPVTVVRLSRNATSVSTPGGSSAVCRVDFDRPLPVAAAIGQVSRMEHDAAPEVVRHVAPWARPLLLRYEREEALVFNLYGAASADVTDEDAERIIDQARRGEVR